MFIFCLCCLILKRHNQKNFAETDVEELTVMVSSMRYKVSVFTFKSVMHSEFIFIDSVRK